MENKDLKLPKNPTLKDFQEYEKRLEKARGFSDEGIFQKCLLLIEEVGELFKVIRKEEGMKMDESSYVGEHAEEAADVFMFLLAVCNKMGIDLEEAFRSKEEKNKKRVWK